MVNKQLFKYITSVVEKSSSQLRPFIVSGELNQEYIKGNQNVKIDQSGRHIVPKKYNPNLYKEKKVFNKIFPIYLARQGILSANRPIPGFKPDHNYMDSITGALMGNRFIREFSKECTFGEMYNQLIVDADIFGLVWFKSGIDWSKGDKTFSAEVKVDDPASFGNNTITTVTKQFYEGRPFVDICSIYEVFPYTLRGNRMEDIPILVHRRPQTIKQIEAKWNKTVTPEPVVFSTSIDNTQKNFTKDDEKYAYVYEYYENPTAKYPKGRYIVACREQIFYSSHLPYVNVAGGKRTIPFDFYNLQPLGGVIPGVTAYSQIIDIQDTYNSIKNRILEYINQIAIGQVFEYADSLVNPDAWTNTPGERIKIKKHAKPPVPVQKAKVGQELQQHAKAVEEDMLVTSGLSPLTAFGQSKSNMRADGIVDKISESDTNKLTVALQNASDTIVRVFKKVLYLEKQRQKILIEDLKLPKRDNFVLKYDLSTVDPEELVIVNREFLMQSDLALEKKMLQATNLGLYTPNNQIKYRSKLEVLEVLNSGYLQDTLDPIERVNFGVIQRDHSAIYAGEEVKVNKEELHAMHIDEHIMELLSPHLAELKTRDPKKYNEVVEALEQHIADHRRFEDSATDNRVFQDAKAFG